MCEKIERSSAPGRALRSAASFVGVAAGVKGIEAGLRCDPIGMCRWSTAVQSSEIRNSQSINPDSVNPDYPQDSCPTPVSREASQHLKK